MFSREQILITNQFVSTLKAWEKAVVRNYGTHDTGYHQLLLFSRDWFEAKDRQLKARLAREAAWRAEWEGKKGQVYTVFQKIDKNKSGTITVEELDAVLGELVGFFGFGAADAAAEEDSAMRSADADRWVQEERANGALSASALFARLDADSSGSVPRPLSLDVGIWDKDYHKDDDLLATQRIDLSTASSGLMRYHRIKCPALAEGAEIKMLAFKWEIVDAEPADDDED